MMRDIPFDYDEDDDFEEDDFEDDDDEEYVNATATFPNVRVKLVGEDGNAFSIIGRVSEALKRGGATTEQVNEFRTDAMSGDYNHLLQVCDSWVTVL